MISALNEEFKSIFYRNEASIEERFPVKISGKMRKVIIKETIISTNFPITS